MELSNPKIISKGTSNREKLTWTEPFFPTGKTPSPKTSVLERHFKDQPESQGVSKMNYLKVNK